MSMLYEIPVYVHVIGTKNMVHGPSEEDVIGIEFDIIIAGERNKYYTYELKRETVEGNNYYIQILMEEDDYRRQYYLGSLDGEHMEERIIEKVGDAIHRIICEKLEEIRE